MLTALRRRLTLLMTALTSLVLAGALVVTWNYAAAQYRTAAETLLTQNFSAIVDRLDSADSVSDAWLADQEHNSGCLLFLWDNGAALHFAGTTGSADARNAVEPLLEEGLSPLLDTSLHDSSGAVQRQSAVFTLNEYRCHAALLPRGTAGSYLLVAALQDMGFVHRHAVQTVVQYGAIWFTGTLLLAIISWRLTGKALAPTALAMRRQKEFIAAAGHELRSPLAVVKASLDAACRTPVTERATLLRNAEQETDRMARLVEDLLVLARLEGQGGALELCPTECAATLDEAGSLCQTRLQERKLRLEGHLEKLPPVLADDRLLTLVFRNLLENACRYAEEETAIRVTGRVEGDDVVIRVVDDGVLIPADDLPRIFERFYQVERHRGQNSTGLGLAICKHVIERHGGRIWAESPAEDGSTAIIFTLRRADAPRTPVQE